MAFPPTLRELGATSLSLSNLFLAVIWSLAFRQGVWAGDEQWDNQFYLAGNVYRSYYALVKAPDGSLIAGGDLAHVADVPGTFAVARWDGSQWSSLAGGGVANAVVYAMVASGSDVYVGGSFTSMGGVWATNVARWDGSGWHAVGDGLSGGTVRSLLFSKGTLYVGGTFTRAGTLPVGQIAAWDGSRWSDLAGGVLAKSVNESFPPVQAMAASEDGLYVGGSFYSAGGTSATNIAYWNGTSWSSVGVGAENGVNAVVSALVADPVDGLFVGGGFSRAGSTNAGLIAQWDGTRWQPLGSGLYRSSVGYVNALRKVGARLYAGGNFTHSGTTFVRGCAYWDGTNWFPSGAPLLAAC